MSRIIDQALLDVLSDEARNSLRRRKNRNFHTHDAAQAHRLLNAIEPDSYIAPHRHLDANKDESIIILRGKLGAVFFDDAGGVTQTVVLQPGGAAVGINVPHGAYHAVLALQAGTVFFEVKAGPYLPFTAEEKAPWAPAETAPAAAGYLERLRALFE